MGSAVAVAAVTLAALAGVANADPSAGVLVSGEPTLQASIQTHAERWLVERGFRIVEKPLGEGGRALVDCFVIEDLTCAQGVFDVRSKGDVLYLRVELLAGDDKRQVALTGYWFSKGAALRAEKRACKDCDDGALGTAVGRLLASLIRIEPPRRTGGSRLWPALAIGAGAGLLAGGATYLFYGQLGGADDPYRYPDATKIGVVLTATGAVALVGGALWWRRVRSERSSGWTRVALVAGGAVALAGGAVALRYASLRGADEPFVYPDAVKLGAPLAIAGGAALAAGTLLWLSKTSVHAAVTPQGAVVGWARRL